MIIVHHLENSRSQRIVWLLEELGIDYEIKRYGRDKQTGLAPPELMKVHPLGKAPVITDGGRTIAESGAIIEYLMYEYDEGRLRPVEGTDERLAYTRRRSILTHESADSQAIRRRVRAVRPSPPGYVSRPARG